MAECSDASSHRRSGHQTAATCSSPTSALGSCSNEPYRIAQATDNYAEQLMREWLLSARPLDDELHRTAFTRSLLLREDGETVLCVVCQQPLGDDPRQIAVLHRSQVTGIPPAVIEVALPF